MPDTAENISGILIFFEDSEYDAKNNSAKQVYDLANQNRYAVLSISTEIPLDFFFANTSASYVHEAIGKVMDNFRIPNKNIFFIGSGLAAHKILRYIQFSKVNNSDPSLNVKGIVLVDGILDWVRMWYSGKKGIRNNFDQGVVWQGNLLIYLLETNLAGTAENDLEKYLDFSSYSYFDVKNRYIKYFKDYSVRAYTEPATMYQVDTKRMTVFDSNHADMVGVITELKLAGNEKSELVIFYPDVNRPKPTNPNQLWGTIDKDELMQWIISQTD